MEDYFLFPFYFKFFGFILIEGMKDYYYFYFPFYFKFFGFILIKGMKDYFSFFLFPFLF